VFALGTIPNWRTGALLASSLVVMAIASFGTHFAAPAEAGGEAAEHAVEHAAVICRRCSARSLPLCSLGSFASHDDAHLDRSGSCSSRH
jgi:hypothetical protein